MRVSIVPQEPEQRYDGWWQGEHATIADDDDQQHNESTRNIEVAHANKSRQYTDDSDGENDDGNEPINTITAMNQIWTSQEKSYEW